MENDKYLKSPAELALETIRDQMGTTFKQYFNGLQDDIPDSLMPCVMATSDGAATEAGATGIDRMDEDVTIIVVLNKKSYLGASQEISFADLQLRRWIYGQNPTTTAYLPQTVMYALRYNFTLDNNVVDNRIDFEFYSAQRGAQTMTRECLLTLTVRRNIVVNSRT